MSDGWMMTCDFKYFSTMYQDGKGDTERTLFMGEKINPSSRNQTKDHQFSRLAFNPISYQVLLKRT